MKSKALLLVALGVSLQSLTAPGGALAAADSKLCAQTRLHLQARLVAASPGGEDADALRGLSPPEPAPGSRRGGTREGLGAKAPRDLAGVAPRSRFPPVSRLPALSPPPWLRARSRRPGLSREGTREARGRAQMAGTRWNERHAGQGDPGLAAAAARPPPVGARAESDPVSWRSRPAARGRAVRLPEA